MGGKTENWRTAILEPRYFFEACSAILSHNPAPLEPKTDHRQPVTWQLRHKNTSAHNPRVFNRFFHFKNVAGERNNLQPKSKPRSDHVAPPNPTWVALIRSTTHLPRALGHTPAPARRSRVAHILGRYQPLTVIPPPLNALRQPPRIRMLRDQEHLSPSSHSIGF